jgi:MFS family permease
MTVEQDAAPARFYWLPPFLRPPAPMTRGQERTFLLVGFAALFAGYDQNVYGFAIPQIQASLHIPEDQVGLTVTFFRFATLLAMLLSLSADIVGRRRLLLITIFGQAAFTLATAFSQDYAQFVWFQIGTRVFGYAEEMLCYVVIVEEVSAGVRGWAAGTLAAMDYTGAGLASLVFAFVTILPGQWRAMYVIGGLSLLFVAFLRRRLPETKRFQIRHEEVEKLHARIGGGFDMARRLVREYPGRLAAVLVTAGAFGFATGPAAVLGNKYLQQTLHYAPWQTTALAVPGGLVALWLNIFVGRLSDRIGRKIAVIGAMVVATGGYAAFYSGIQGWPIPVLWVLSYFAFFSTEAMFSGYSLEIVPTAYRATVSGLRYAAYILMGGLSLGLEGVWYDRLHAHGPAISVSLAAMPIAVIALLFLPEPAGKTLEELTGQPAA